MLRTIETETVTLAGLSGFVVVGVVVLAWVGGFGAGVAYDLNVGCEFGEVERVV